MHEVSQILTSIQSKDLKPIYFLMGEESYFIDLISNAIENSVLSEEEKGFNQTVYYGRDVKVEDIVGAAKRFPMMAEHQVVIVKEAQDLARQIDKLDSYVKNPQLSTILVINYKYKSLDKRKALYKSLKKNAVIVESKKLYDNQVVDWVIQNSKQKGYDVPVKTAHLLVESLGTDLNRVNNELEKMFSIVDSSTTITPKVIEQYIGISKDFNNFELKSAIAERNITKTFKIADYFANNPKSNPYVVTITLLFNFFSQLMIYHGLADKSKSNAASKLGVNPFFIKEFEMAARNYPMKKVSAIIGQLRDSDMKGKGVNSNGIPQRDLLNELLVLILN